jgi:hypothetical protein
MKPDKQQLIHELLDGESRREATLLTAAKILRRRRRGRATGQVLALVVLVSVTGLLLDQQNQRPGPAQTVTPSTQSSAPRQAKSLTDDELLALFPNTPVGLATLPNGKKLLLFPRPGDQARFVIKL